MNEEKKTILVRATLIYVATALMGILILYRVWHIQFPEGDKWTAQAAKITYKTQEVEAMRGNIFASNGTLLVTSVPMFDIYMDVDNPNITDADFSESIRPLATGLSSLLQNRSSSWYLNKLTRARRQGERYTLIKRDVTYNQLKHLRKLPLFRRGRFAGGLIVEPKTERIKPYESLASRTLGFINKEAKDVDSVGIEGAYDKYLQGSKGKRLMQQIANGELIPVNYKNQIEPQNGLDIISTIDVNIQDVAESSLKEQLIKHDALFGTAIVMETKTGYIKAISNLGKISEGIYGEIYNYAIGRPEAPGSTFKLASFLAALEDNLLPPLTDTIDAGNGRKRFADRFMTDAHRGGFGKITVRDVFEKSSNIGVSTIITEAYEDPKDYLERIDQFHLNSKLGIDLKGEKDPYIRQTESKSWSAVSLPWLSIGYESRLSPLHILTFYNAIANNGKMMKPQFVSAIENSGKIYKRFEPEVIDKSIASQRNIDTVKSLLRGGVENGTASNLKNTIYTIAGKTGTAQVANRNQGYNKRDYRASFVGYFPAEFPQYTIMVMISNPTKGIYYGNIVAGSVFRDIADKIYATHIEIEQKEIKKVHSSNPPILVVGKKEDMNTIYSEMGYGMSNPDIASDWVVSMQHGDTLKYGYRIFDDKVIPNVKGMSAKDAIYLLEKLGLKVVVHGQGKVSRQSVLAGTPSTKGRKIELYLS